MRRMRNIGCLAMLLVIFLAGLAVTQRENLRGFIRSHFHISLEKAALDPMGLLEKTLRGKLKLNVYNSLPIGATLQNLNYSILLNDQEVGSGFQVAPQAGILGMATSTLEISLTLDAAKARQALQSADIGQKLKMLGNLVDQVRKKKKEGGSTGEGLLRIVGSASFDILAGTVQIPLDKSASFQKEF